MRKFFLSVLIMLIAPAIAVADPIHDAARSGDLAAITAALDGGADVNASDGTATPLYFAVRRKHFEAAKLLLERGADVNAKTNIGSPLQAAVAKSNIELINLLLSNGANANAVYAGNAVIHEAAKLSCLDCFKALVAAGADVNVLTNERETALHLARRLGNRDIADYLVAYGVVPPKAPPVSAKLATADAYNGHVFFKHNCLGCHHNEPNAVKKTGPNLWGVVGRDKATYQDFLYSPSLKAWEGVWTYEDLNTFLFAPKATMPGVAMNFAGIEDDIQRANVIVYLRSLSDKPIPLP